MTDPTDDQLTEETAHADEADARAAHVPDRPPTPEEEAAVLRAHRAALHQSHRALLFMAPRDPARIDALTEEIEASGLIVARSRIAVEAG